MLATTEQVLVWARRIEAQRSQTAVIYSLSKIKDFDKICARKGEQDKIKPHTAVTMPIGKMQILWFKPPLQMMPSMWEERCQVQQHEPI